MMRETRVVRRLSGLLLACLLAACAPAVPTESPAPPFRVAWTLREGDYTLLIAQEMGYFEDHGVQVEPVLYDTSLHAIPDISGAEIEGGLMSVGELILASSVSDLKAVLVYDSGPIYSVVASPDIATVADLRGRRLGVNLHTSSGMFLTYMLDRLLPSAGQVQMVEMSPEQVVAGIPDQVDAGLVWEPFTTQALQQGDKILFTSDTYSALVPGMIVFRGPVARQYPDQIRAFLLAWNDAVNYRTSHAPEAMELIAKVTGLPRTQLGISGRDTLYTIDDNVGLFADPAGNDPTSIYYVANFNLNYVIGLGDITTPPDIEAILDPSFLR
jgi:NitT/TauT family transport system substrate-binding protein